MNQQELRAQCLALADQMVAEMVGDSYQLVVASLPKASRPAF